MPAVSSVTGCSTCSRVLTSRKRDGAVASDEIFDRAGAVVAGLAADRLGGGVDLGALLVGQERRGRLFDELLVAALQRAVAGADDDDVAVRVGEHLCLDVTRLVEITLDEAFTATESSDRLAGRRREQLRDLFHRAGDLQTSAAAAEGRLDRDRKPVFGRERDHLVGPGDRLRGAGHERRTGAGRDVSGGHLVAEVADRLRRRADPGQPGVDHGLSELGVLGEKAVAGVYAVGAGPRGDVDELVDAQVGVGGGVAPERVGLVGQRHVHRVPIGVGVDGDAREAGVTTRPNHADGDLATVGDQNFAHVVPSQRTYPRVVYRRS